MLDNMFKLSGCLASIGIDITPVETANLQLDSRKIKVGDVFVAVPGALADGRQYVAKAIVQGAVAVLVETEIETDHGLQYLQTLEGNSALTVEVFKLKDRLATIASQFYGQPSEALTTIGVTGTNGKTSTVYYISQLLQALGEPTATIGTLGYGQSGNFIETENTTPGPCKIQQLFHEFHSNGAKNVAMEVSSHALEQKRVVPEQFDVAVFTNLSRDHLDYHGTMEAYAASKAKLFVDNDNQAWVMNIDDAQTNVWLSTMPLSSKLVVYGCHVFPETSHQYSNYVFAKNVKYHQRGLSFIVDSSWGNAEISLPLLGEFNVHNVLAAIAVALSKGQLFDNVVTTVTSLHSVPGRMELFEATGKPTTVVDYAHTPDALEKAIVACKQHCDGEVWVVFGCGGDRDSGKRPLMGAIALEGANKIILTNDNPRTENPQRIIDDIKSGMMSLEHVKEIIDREEAVNFAVANANSNDIVLLAGKGHEDYLIIGENKLQYNEREIVRNLYKTEVSA